MFSRYHDEEPVKEIVGSASKNIMIDHTSDDSLVNGIRKAIDLPRLQRLKVGLENRRKAEEEFSRLVSLKNWTVLLGN